MKKNKKLVIMIGIALAALSLSLTTLASSFVVEKIQIDGLKRIKRGTVLNYLPVRVGQTLNTEETSGILKALYDTGFFSDIDVDRQGNTLLIKVEESPTVGALTVSGNKSIPTKDLLKVLKGVGMAQGLVYNQSVLEQVKQSLINQYYDRGNYNAKVNTTVTPQSENRVSIHISISEGPAATIKQIRIIGAHAFKTKELLSGFKLSTTNLLSFFYKDDQYSREKLDADLEGLKSYYQNRGYIKFKINSTHVTLTPDKRHVYIVIDVTEGSQYTISGYKLAGHLIRPEPELQKFVLIKKGDIFSRAYITRTTTNIGNYLGNYGYVYAKVEPVPDVDDATKTVFMTFIVTPDNRYYVRKITFSGNTKTLDHVLRNALRQQESAQASLKNIQDSEHNLNLLGFVKGVTVNNEKVAGSDDQVDVNFNVTERPSATLTAGAGYSDAQGLLLNAGYSQPNFLGTGKSVSANIGRTDSQTDLSFNYFNPYYTDSGIGRGIGLFASSMDAGELNNKYSTYIMNNYGVNMNYSIPVAPYRSLNLGIGYQLTSVQLGNQPSDELLNFFNGTNCPVPFGPVPVGNCQTTAYLVNKYRKDTQSFYNVLLTSGMTFGSFDRGILPTRGFMQSYNATIALPGGGPNNLEYYTLDYTTHWYQPLFKGFIFSLRTDLGYGGTFSGGEDYPFFRNYNAGGIGVQGSVRGYYAYSLGPKDSNDNNMGANFLASGSASLILPRPLSGDSFRTSTFVDFGNVYNTTGIQTTTGSGPLRFSAGVALDWQSPMGPLEFSLASPLNARHGDNIENFQFTVTTAL
jgi:outer membrane protein insertion porin family